MNYKITGNLYYNANTVIIWVNNANMAVKNTTRTTENKILILAVRSKLEVRKNSIVY